MSKNCRFIDEHVAVPCAASFLQSEAAAVAVVEEPEVTGTTWTYAILASIFMGAVPVLVGVLLICLRKEWLVTGSKVEILFLSAGALIGTAMFIMIPEAVVFGGYTPLTGFAIVLGICAGMIIDMVGGHKHHIPATATPTTATPTAPLTADEENPAIEGAETAAETETAETETLTAPPTKEGPEAVQLVSTSTSSSAPKPLLNKESIWVSVLGDFTCNFVDGGVIAAAFMYGTSTGITTTAAVCLHEFPQELGDLLVLISAGCSLAKALVVSLVSGAFSILGAVFTLALGTHFSQDAVYITPFASGVFLFLSLTKVLPLMSAPAETEGDEKAVSRSQAKRKLILFLCFAAGLGLATLGFAIPHEHAHGGHGEESGVDSDPHAGHNH